MGDFLVVRIVLIRVSNVVVFVFVATDKSLIIIVLVVGQVSIVAVAVPLVSVIVVVTIEVFAVAVEVVLCEVLSLLVEPRAQPFHLWIPTQKLLDGEAGGRRVGVLNTRRFILEPIKTVEVVCWEIVFVVCV